MLAISGVCERDIDLLLVEEFTATPAFLDWFAREIGLSGRVELVTVDRSVTSSNGESDVELTVSTDGGTVKVLIENKVDASFQPKQPERYRDRAASYLLQGTCASAVTVIVAPAVYYTDDSEHYGFDRRMTYETLLSWFESSNQLGARSPYKRALLTGAISRGGAGWQLVPDVATTMFWEGYWQLTRSLAPQLRMPRPTSKPAGSSFVRFDPEGLPAHVGLFHKIRHGNVDLQFAAMGDRVLDLENRYGDRLGPDMRVEQAAKSAVIRVRARPIDMALPFETSESAVREGLSKAVSLLAWYREQAGTIEP
jgi:hypothetical protein